MRQLIITLFSFLCSVNCDRLILSGLIDQGKIDEAKNLSRVRDLPGAPLLESYSGYFTVDAKHNSNTFFWFFPSFNTPEKAPVILWLSGGPGGSSMGSLFSDQGPYTLFDNGTIAISRYGWPHHFSMAAFDNPIGTGFSFTDNELGYSTTEEQVADNLYSALRQFNRLFPEYTHNGIYIAGSSYAGKYIPALGYKLMLLANESGIDFRGVAIGNGLTDPINMLKDTALLRSLGLIDKKQEEEMKRWQDKVRDLYNKQDYLNASIAFAQLDVSIQGPSLAQNLTGLTGELYDVVPQPVVKEGDLEPYLNRADVQEAIHVGQLNFTIVSPMAFLKLLPDVIKSMEANLTMLIPHYKVLLYVGNLDNIVGVDEINGMLENPKWKYVDQYYNANKVIWKVAKNDTMVAGYAKSFGKFTMLVVRNAGHGVSVAQPRANQDLMIRFINDIPWDQLI